MIKGGSRRPPLLEMESSFSNSTSDSFSFFKLVKLFSIVSGNSKKVGDMHNLEVWISKSGDERWLRLGQKIVPLRISCLVILTAESDVLPGEYSKESCRSHTTLSRDVMAYWDGRRSTGVDGWGEEMNGELMRRFLEWCGGECCQWRPEAAWRNSKSVEVRVNSNFWTTFLQDRWGLSVDQMIVSILEKR